MHLKEEVFFVRRDGILRNLITNKRDAIYKGLFLKLQQKEEDENNSKLHREINSKFFHRATTLFTHQNKFLKQTYRNFSEK